MKRFALALAVGAAFACAASAQHYTDATDFPHLKYADSLTSANDRCIVSQAKLNPKMAPLYVNGVPIGFC